MDSDKDILLFGVAALFHAGRLTKNGEPTPMESFDEAEKFIEEARARGIKLPGDK